MHQPGPKEYEAACKRIQTFHDKTHIKDAGKIEKMIVTNRDTGLRPLRVCYIPTDMNIADFFTKALTEAPFCKFRAFLGISE